MKHQKLNAVNAVRQIFVQNKESTIKLSYF
jgi:hypothetical protein